MYERYLMMGKVDFTGSWIFICNPKYWNIYGYLNDLKNNKVERFDSWSIPDWQFDAFKPGQIGIVRVGHDKRTKSEIGDNKKLERGVYAIVKVVSYPKAKTNQVNDPYRISPDASYVKKSHFVEIEYISNLIDSPILMDQLMNNHILSEDSFLINGYQGSSIPLSLKSMNELLKLTSNPVNDSSELTLTDLSETEKESIIKSRLGHGKLRKQVLSTRPYKCELCNVDNERFLIMSHIKPWSKSSNQERLDSNNVMLLCPNHDKLFDSGYITFDSDGKIVFSKYLSIELQNAMDLNLHMKLFSTDSNVLNYMKWHRENVFLE